MAANPDRSDGFRWSDIHASDNARQHVGPAYHYETHNYAGPTSHMNVPVKPWKDPVHGDLIRACRQGQGPRRLNFLFARGADIDYRDEQQRTPLHHAASSGFLSTLSHLVDSGGDVHACAPRFGAPLHCAALSGSARAVKFLVDAGAKVNTLDKIVGTPLHCAAFCGSADTVRCLLESGAEMNTVSDWVGTPLSIAAAKVHMDVLEVLLEYGVNVNEPCGYFGSAAHMACAVGSIQLLQRLQRAGAGFDRSVDTCLLRHTRVSGSIIHRIAWIPPFGRSTLDLGLSGNFGNHPWESGSG
jgi:ankyrin repeat protein